MGRKAAALRRKDPFVMVGEAVVAAADAVKQSTSDARQAASQAVPAVRSAVAKTVYTVSYYTSYGVVFTALTAMRLTPLENALGYGLRDGAVAARDARTGPVRQAKAAGNRVSTRRRNKRSRLPTRPVEVGSEA
jgi:hypothetical protein